MSKAEISRPTRMLVSRFLKTVPCEQWWNTTTWNKPSPEVETRAPSEASATAGSAGSRSAIQAIATPTSTCRLAQATNQSGERDSIASPGAGLAVSQVRNGCAMPGRRSCIASLASVGTGARERFGEASKFRVVST